MYSQYQIYKNLISATVLERITRKIVFSYKSKEMAVYEKLTYADNSKNTKCFTLSRNGVFGILAAVSVMIAGLVALVWAWTHYTRTGYKSPLVVGAVLLFIGLSTLIFVICLAYQKHVKLKNRKPTIYQVELSASL